MRLSLFRAKSNADFDRSPSSTSTSSAKKTGNRFSQMLSPTRFRSDASDQRSTSAASGSQTDTSLQNGLDSVDATQDPLRANQLGHLSSPNGAQLPTSEPDNSLHSSSSNFEPTDAKTHIPSRGLLDTIIAEDHDDKSFDRDPTATLPSYSPALRSRSSYPNTSSAHSRSPRRAQTNLGRTQALDPALQRRTTRSNDRLSGRISASPDDQQTDRRASEVGADHGLSHDVFSLNPNALDRSDSPSAAAARRNDLKLRAARYKPGAPARIPLASSTEDALKTRQSLLEGHSARVRLSHTSLSSRSNRPFAINGVGDSHEEDSSSRRPKYLSIHGHKESSGRESDLTIEPEDDVTVGGQSPGLGRLERVSSLSSLASTASDMDRASHKGQNIEIQSEACANLDPVAELDADRTPSQQQTPRARQYRFADPTDTVLAKHVREIKVPPTVVRQYTAAQRAPSAMNLLSSSSPYTAVKNNLTLKEQNARIDGLTKENFDLKLKIHFLSQALGERSDEGVQDTVSKNAQLQADLVSLKKENLMLRKRIRTLEKQQVVGGGSSAAPSNFDSEDGSRSMATQQLEEEMGYMQQRLVNLEYENAQLVGDGQYVELYTRLDQEVARRAEAERLVRSTQAELRRLRREQSPASRHRRINGESTDNRSRSRLSHVSGQDTFDTNSLSGVTLVEQLRKENEMLRRDLGAQASMLTSRNREKDRLQQEIEAIKLLSRRGASLGPASTAGDSILDRSVSRAQYRSTSRTSESTRASHLSEPERDLYESTQAGLRDENSMLKMQIQDLEVELDSLGNGAEHIRDLQDEREEALQAFQAASADIEELNDQLKTLERRVQEKVDTIADLQDALQRRELESEEFRVELQNINQSFNNVVDESENAQATIQSLQQDLAIANGELEALETNLRTLALSKERLEVQQESSQNEIDFLRDEQESDKIQIGELQSALRIATSAGQDGERSEALAEIARNHSRTRDDMRQLRAKVSKQETEIKHLQDELNDSTATLEEAMSNFDLTKASYVEEIAQLQQETDRLTTDLEQMSKARELDRKSHEEALEESGQHIRKLTGLVDKERLGKMHDRNEHERALQRGKGSPEARIVELERSRSKAQSRIVELEQSLASELQTRNELLQSIWNRLATICNIEGITEQQELIRSPAEVTASLSNLKQQLSGTLEAVASHLRGFRNKIDQTEARALQDLGKLSATLADRTTRLERLEAGLANPDPQNDRVSELRDENKLLRRELDFLKQGSFALPGLFSTPDEPLLSIRDDTAIGQHAPSPDLDQFAMPSPHVPHGPKEQFRLRRSTRPSSILMRLTPDRGGPRTLSTRSSSRHLTSALQETAEAASEDDQEDPQSRIMQHVQQGDDLNLEPTPRNARSSNPDDAVGPSNDPVWMWKLEDVVGKLRLERERRLLDRKAARDRIVEGERERDDLRAALRREKVRPRSVASLAEREAPSERARTEDDESVD